MKHLRNLKNPWLWKMAWRDSRTHRKRLFLFMTTILFGIAALVAIGSFGKNLEQAVADQAKTLLGADLMFESLQPYNEEIEALIDSIGGEQARETLFNSMAYFPKTGDTRLVQVRAIAGNFPFYGKLGTEPKNAAKEIDAAPNALVDETLLLQYGIGLQDSIKIGAKTFAIHAKLTQIPNQSPIASTFSPRVLIAAKYIDQTHLLQRGSLVNYNVYFKFNEAKDIQKLVDSINPRVTKNRIRVDTVEKRKERVSNIIENMYRFLNLVGFVALILGSIGVGSAVHVYILQKLGDVSILRCLGAEASETFLIYLIQIGVLAFVGSVIGAVFGIIIQFFLPEIFQEFIPITVDYFIAWGAVFKGILTGLILAFLFALLPLLAVRKVSPLLALRSNYEGTNDQKDRMRWLIYGLIVITASVFGMSQTSSPVFGLWFVTGILIAFCLLALVAKLIIFLTKRYFPKSWTYVWRQGLANLYRPNNQTLILMLSIGLGTFLITTLYLSHNTLLEKVTFVGGGDRPNLVLFDIHPDQKEDITKTILSFDLPVLQEAPMITMRIQAINGRTVEDILSDTTRTTSKGLLRWEYRTTYRDSLFDSETLVEGKWVSRVDENAETIPISFEEGAANRLHIGLGDTIVWDVQGVPLTTTIASLRKVDWQRIQANFMVVFPPGALEYAPQIYILATRAPTTAKSAELQRALVKTFPNVSMIDLALVLSTMDNFLSKISFVIRFMAFFSIFTGLIVLAAAVITSRYQRIRESILLRTLGASKKQIVQIMIIEYIFLGGFAAITGLLLSYFSGWALAFFVFESVFVPSVLPFVIILLSVILLTILIGMSNSRGILDRPPLEVLRLEA